MDGVTTNGGAVSVSGFVRAAKLLFTNPRGFFAGMPKSGGYAAPAAAVLFWSFISGLVGFLLSFAVPRMAAGTVAQRVGALIAGPIGVLLGTFIFAAFLFVIWHLMGSKEDYQTAFRVAAFLSPLSVAGAVLGVVPFASLLVLIALCYGIVVASEEVHGLPRDRAWLVWGVIFAVILLAGLVGNAAAPGFTGLER